MLKLNQILFNRVKIKIKKRLKMAARIFPEISLDEESLKRKLLLLLGIFLAAFVIFFQAASENLKQVDTAPKKQLSAEKVQLQKNLAQMVDGYPIERMIPFIVAKDEKVAAFLIGIAKKESNWGKRVPVLDGKDCFNYWGFRLKAERMGSGGHTCFDNPRQAVNAVSRRIEELVREEQIDTPKKMVLWKCGYACNGPERFGADKWIRDVAYYYDKVIE